MKFIFTILGVSCLTSAEGHLRASSKSEPTDGATDNDYVYGNEETSDQGKNLDFAAWEHDNSNDDGDQLDNGTPYLQEEMNKEEADPARPIISEEDDESLLQKRSTPGADSKSVAAEVSDSKKSPPGFKHMKKLKTTDETSEKEVSSDAEGVGSDDFEADINAANSDSELVDQQGHRVNLNEGDDSDDLVGSDVDSEDGHIIETMPILMQTHPLHDKLTNAEYIDEVRQLAFLQEHGDNDDDEAFEDPSNYNIGQYFSESSRQEVAAAAADDDDDDLDPSRFEDSEDGGHHDDSADMQDESEGLDRLDASQEDGEGDAGMQNSSDVGPNDPESMTLLEKSKKFKKRVKKARKAQSTQPSAESSSVSEESADPSASSVDSENGASDSSVSMAF